MTQVWECREPGCGAGGHSYNADQVRRDSTTHCLTFGHVVVGYPKKEE